MEVDSTLSEAELRKVFQLNVSHGAIPGPSHWDFGKRFIGKRVARSYDAKMQSSWIGGPDLRLSLEANREFQQKIAAAAALPQASIFQISAERNVEPEGESDPTPVQPNGNGLTNLVRGFLYDTRFSMADVEQTLLSDLNAIYRGDTQFRRILCRRDPSGQWEIYLTDDSGSTVRLSESGSSLKSIFIILATIRLNPIIAHENKIDDNVFCVEEPENNLHPALLRRLLDFLASARAEANSSLVFTTHSPTAIDWASRREDCATYHVRRFESGSRVHEAKEYLALRTLLQDLDIRASEILQANGVIWVEGPSDRLYMRKWISMISKGELREGVHYSVMFYGGKLLSHLSTLPPEEVEEAVSLLLLNKNLILVMDSDRRRLPSGRFRSGINDTKRRLIRECEKVRGLVWLTRGREIENYLSPRILRVLSNSNQGPVGEFDSVPDSLGAWKGDKVSLAHAAMEITEESDLNHLDLVDRLQAVRRELAGWNSLE